MARTEKDERSKKKKSKQGNRGLLLGLAAGAIVLVVVIALVIVFANGSGAKPPQNVAQKKEEEPPGEEREFKVDEPPKKPPQTGLGRLMEKNEMENALKQIGLAYRNFEVTANRGPKDVKELSPYYEKVARITEALEKKWIAFPWGLGRNPFPDGASNTILAYETVGDRFGNRIVIMGDLSIHQLNEDEFKKKPIAKGK